MRIPWPGGAVPVHCKIVLNRWGGCVDQARRASTRENGPEAARTQRHQGCKLLVVWMDPTKLPVKN
jgi:hypothetical protein